MAILSKGTTYSTGDQVTAANLNALVDSATFDDPADETSLEKNTGTGKLQVKDGGVSTAKIADLGVTTAKLAATSVTTAKIGANAVTNAKLELSGSGVGAVAGSASAATGANVIEPASIDTAELADDSVTYAKVDTATQAEQEAESAAGVVTPDVLKYHPGVAKAWGKVTQDSTVSANPTLDVDYNIASVANHPGESQWVDVTLDNAMADTNYIVTAVIAEPAGTDENRELCVEIVSESVFSVGGNTNADRSFFFSVFGNLA